MADILIDEAIKVEIKTLCWALKSWNRGNSLIHLFGRLNYSNCFQDYDLNDDRRIDLAEYMKAVFGEGALEGEWKEGEEQFVKDRDLDQDGFMDKEEVRSWMLPEAYDEHQVEETNDFVQI